MDPTALAMDEPTNAQITDSAVQALYTSGLVSRLEADILDAVAGFDNDDDDDDGEEGLCYA